MYGLSCISLHDYKLELCGKLFQYVDLYRRKISKLTPTEIDYLYFIYVPLNEFRSGRDGFHAPSETFISAQRHDSRQYVVRTLEWFHGNGG